MQKQKLEDFQGYFFSTAHFHTNVSNAQETYNILQETFIFFYLFYFLLYHKKCENKYLS